MKKVILKCKLTSRDKFEEKLTQCGGNLEDGEQRGRNADLGGVGAKASCHFGGEGKCGCLQDHL